MMTEFIGQATPEQVAAWKVKHGDVYAIRVEGHVAYFCKPSRKTLSYASAAGKNDPLKFGEVLVRDCFLGGSEEVKTDDSMFFAVSAKVSELVEVKEAELEKL